RVFGSGKIDRATQPKPGKRRRMARSLSVGSRPSISFRVRRAAMMSRPLAFSPVEYLETVALKKSSSNKPNRSDVHLHTPFKEVLAEAEPVPACKRDYRIRVFKQQPACGIVPL